MILADYQAVSRGLDAIAQRRRDDQEQQLRRDLLRRQLERDAEEQQLRRDLLKRQQQQADDATADRQAATAVRRDALKAKLDAAAWARDPNNPNNQERAAQIAHFKAQTEALAAKPATPINAQLQGLDEFTSAFTAALQENQQALGAIQADPANPAAQAAATKAQLKLGTLKAYGDKLLQGVKPDKPTSLVKIKRASEDGQTTEELEVPADQWNERHPAWGRFNPAPAAAGASRFPAPTPQAIQYLRANPNLRGAFEAKYGPGSAAAALK